MERKFLEELGLEKDVIDKVLNAHSAEIGTLKKSAEDAGKDRDQYKGQLDTVTAQLKAFDGVDVEKLKGDLQTLQGELATQQATHAADIADRDFQSLLRAGISDAKGKNATAILALLPADTLKVSKNQKEDVAAALKALRESDPYLFDDGKAADTLRTTVSTGGTHSEDGARATSANALMNSAIRGAAMEGE